MAATDLAAEIAVAAFLVNLGSRKLRALAQLVEERPGPPMKMRVDDVHVSLLPGTGIKMAEDTTILVKGAFPVNATPLEARNADRIGVARVYAALSALGLAPVATANAARDSMALAQRDSSGNAGFSIGKARQRTTSGASAMSAMVRRSSANHDLPARCPSRIFICATRSALCAGKSAARSASGFLASLNTAT